MVQEQPEMERQCEDPGSMWLLPGLIEVREPDTEEDSGCRGEVGTTQMGGLQVTDLDSGAGVGLQYRC